MALNTLSRVHTDEANPRQFTSDDLIDNKVVQSDEFVAVAEQEGNTSRAFGAGFGPANQNINNDGWSDLTMQVADDDGGTNAADAAGQFRYEVYSDPNKDDLIAYSGTFGASGLAVAEAAARTDKALIPGMLSDVAGNDSYLVLAYQATAGEDGQMVYQEGSTHELGMAYSEVRTN